MDASKESARPTPASRAPLGGGGVAPAGRPGLVARITSGLRESVWAPVGAKALAIAAGMVALAAIGAASTLGARGVPVAGAAPVTSAAPSTSPASGSATFASASGMSVLPSPAGVAPETSGSAASLPAQQSPAITADGKIVLNLATVEDLVKLPRVGPKRAEAIVELRKRLGRFHQVTDLLRVKGIGRKTLKLMMPKLVVDAP